MKQNTIVFLETGSGKTLIAIMLLRSYAHLLRKPSTSLAVFLVPTVVLVSQVCQDCGFVICYNLIMLDFIRVFVIYWIASWGCANAHGLKSGKVLGRNGSGFLECCRLEEAAGWLWGQYNFWLVTLHFEKKKDQCVCLCFDHFFYLVAVTSYFVWIITMNNNFFLSFLFANDVSSWK